MSAWGVNKVLTFIGFYPVYMNNGQPRLSIIVLSYRMAQSTISPSRVAAVDPFILTFTKSPIL